MAINASYITMNKDLENSEWKEFAPSLANRQKVDPFSTPTDYFKNLLPKINTSIFLNELEHDQEFYGLEVPKDYFENLAGQIETSVNLSENIKRTSSFEIPPNYFEQLRHKIEAKTSSSTSKRKRKHIKLWSTLTKYAVAASIVVVASVGIYRYTENTVNVPISSGVNDMASEQFLYDIDENTIIQHIDNEQKIPVKNVSSNEADMESYLINHYTANELARDL